MTYAEVRDNPTAPAVTEAVGYVESAFPVMSKRFRELAGDGIMYAFFCIKQKDYGPENIRGGNDLTTRFGRMMSIREVGRRSGDKVSRIANLTLKSIETRALEEARERVKSTTDADVIETMDEMIASRAAANEPLTDSFVDLAIYGVIMILVEEGVWGK